MTTKISTQQPPGPNPKHTSQGRVDRALELFGPDLAQRYPKECHSEPRKNSFRSNMAFRLTVEYYLEEARREVEAANALIEREEDKLEFFVRLWTLTAADAISYDEFMERWNAFMTAMKRYDKKFSAIRVLEAHPGEDYEIPGEPGRWGTISHGLHMHYVTNRFYSQGIIQGIAHRVGLGHLSVSGRCATGESHNIKSVTNYLSKYLRKSLWENSPGLRGRRMWAPINYPNAVRVRDILNTSRWRVVYERLSYDEYFCDQSFSTRAEIAGFGEMVSRFVDKGMDSQLDELAKIRATECTAYSVEKLIGILKPSWICSGFCFQDCERYAHLPASFGWGWPGVGKYLGWLNSTEGLKWAHQRKDERIEIDRQRQRERRRELAYYKKLKDAGAEPIDKK